MEKIYSKIKKQEELKEIIGALKGQNKKIVQCHGVFDLIHPGHIRHLATAKKEGNVLVVTVTADEFVRKGPGRPIFNEQLRAENLAALEIVDYVAVNREPTAVNCIRRLRPDVYVKGQDYADKEKDITGKIGEEEEAVVSVGGRMAFTNEIAFSSSKLINEHLPVFPAQTRAYLKEIAGRYPPERIFRALDGLKGLKVAVIGEAIIDQYHFCEGMDKSRKSNVVVYKYLSEESFAGGSLAIANHIAGVCDNVTLITATGSEPELAEFISLKMNPRINIVRFRREDAPTIIKRRFVNQNQKLFEICYLNESYPEQKAQRKINTFVGREIGKYDAVVVADFGHGLFNSGLIKIICDRAKFLAVNTQTNGANMGFNLITHYSGIDYASLDELELRYAAHDRDRDLGEVMRSVAKRIGCRTLAVTRGYLGALGLSRKNGLIEAPALASNVVDPVGAGDAFLSFTAPLVAMGAPDELVLFIGNAVGALAVQIVCNRQPVDPVYLKKFITTLLKG
jgi:rfaE bifunctional protein nucleotidyltransferase chain/domain